MRVFFALPISKTLEEECLNFINKLKSSHHAEEVRWTKSDHLHITVRFIAEITDEQLTQLNEILPAALSQCKAVTLESRRLLFIPPRKPHLISMGIHLNQDLANLFRIVNAATATAGLTPEHRPFVPHITLGRFKNPTLGEYLHPPIRPIVSSTMQELKLYKSEPNDTGSVYTELQSFSLTAT